MPNDIQIIEGGCACGAVRFTAEGPPLRVGLCHCMTCRKAHGSAYNPFVVYPATAVRVSGPVRSWFSSEDYDRRFCERCGSRVVGMNGDEAELSLGGFDEPGVLAPEYEVWIRRREPWLKPLPVPQFEEGRDDPA